MTPPSIGPYRILRELGRGGMGVVYQAEDPALGRRVAVKQVLAAGAADPELLLRFRREADALARVNHPGVVRVHAVEATPQGPLLVTELIEGEGLDARLARGPLPPEEARRLVAAVADAVAALHAAGVIHRDLKPSNVMVRPDGSPVLLDFGLARDLGGESLTQTGTLLGTPGYMAPEQARGERAQDERVDVYGLGALLFACLAGRAPFRGATPFAALQQVLNAEAGWPSDAPPALVAAGRRALAKEPARRFPDARAFRAALLGIPGAVRPRRRLRRGVLASGCAGVGLAAAAALLHAGSPQPGGAPQQEIVLAEPLRRSPPARSRPSPPAVPTAAGRPRLERLGAIPLEGGHPRVAFGEGDLLFARLDAEERRVGALRANPRLTSLWRRTLDAEVHDLVWDERCGGVLALTERGIRLLRSEDDGGRALFGYLTGGGGAIRTMARAPDGGMAVGVEAGLALLRPDGTQGFLAVEHPPDLVVAHGEVWVCVKRLQVGASWLYVVDRAGSRVGGASLLQIRLSALLSWDDRLLVGTTRGHLLEYGLEGDRLVRKGALALPGVGVTEHDAFRGLPEPRAHREAIAALARFGRLLCVASGEVHRPPFSGGLAVWDPERGSRLLWEPTEPGVGLVDLDLRERSAGRARVVVATTRAELMLYELRTQ